MRVAVGVMARAPSSGGKTRLAPHLSPARLLALRSAMLTDTLHALASVCGLTIFFTPDDVEDEIAGFARAGVPLVAQGDGDLGARMLAAIRHLLAGGFDSAILVGSDIPLLSANHITEASGALRAGGGVVLGPADDGGYYLIGMTEPLPPLFDEIEWGSERVLADTLQVAKRTGLDARLVQRCYDIDTIEDLRRVERDLAALPPEACPSLRRWLSGA
jgi:uncharacterized protein